MTVHKFTDDDVRVALRCHADERNRCDICPYRERGGCSLGMSRDALALINRQKAQIDELKVELDAMRGAANSYKMHYEETERKYKIAVAEREANVEGFIETLKTIKAEAIKEFAENVKAIFECVLYFDDDVKECILNEIDELVKEMTEESK